ncbi:patatin-like phospholipase family protein [Nocardia seriolae]|uniref:patatin-like phospholipase family protein n=1 Tax=Nocardia seriolae TaxID=37332 RepID=UPI0033659EEB
MAGLAAELRRRGIDLGMADSIVGTSAGAVVGAALVAGRDLDSFADDPRFPGSVDSAPVVKAELIAKTFAVLFDRTLDRQAARREVGRLAMGEEPAQAVHIAPMQWLVGGSEWPDDRLRVAVVDAASGERRVWDSGSGVPLATAVTASRSFPGPSRPSLSGTAVTSMAGSGRPPRRTSPRTRTWCWSSSRSRIGSRPDWSGPNSRRRAPMPSCGSVPTRPPSTYSMPPQSIRMCSGAGRKRSRRVFARRTAWRSS